MSVFHSLIKDILNESALNEETFCVLANAIYFKSDWVNKLKEKRSICWRNFDGSEQMIVAMSVADVTVPYRKTREFQIAKLPYENGYSMVIFLPRSNDYHPSQLTFDVFKNNVPTKTCSLGHVVMPKWSLDSGSMKLMEVCKELGIRRLFGSSDLFYVDALFQKAKIIVDSDGTTAAAATLAVKAPKSPFHFELPKETLIIDHPFFYAILNESTQTIEFIGYLMTPPSEPECKSD